MHNIASAAFAEPEMPSADNNNNFYICHGLSHGPAVALHAAYLHLMIVICFRILRVDACDIWCCCCCCPLANERNRITLSVRQILYCCLSHRFSCAFKIHRPVGSVATPSLQRFTLLQRFYPLANANRPIVLADRWKI